LSRSGTSQLWVSVHGNGLVVTNFPFPNCPIWSAMLEDQHDVVDATIEFEF